MSERHALIITLNAATDAPRVGRQAQALHEADWRVTVAGLRGRGPAPEFWRHVEVAHLPNGLGLSDAIRSELGKYLSRFSEGAAERAYWRAVGYEGIYRRLASIEPPDYDLVLGHDWMAAPIAARLAAARGVPFSIDVHEYARGQYVHTSRRLRWRELPWANALQSRFLPRADGLTTVSDGIADLLQRDYALPERPTVVRGFAPWRELSPRPTGERITVLYHGALVPGRGLEEAIASTPRWRPELRLVIRGVGDPGYIATLRELVDRAGASGRVTIEGPVPAAEMIERANADADVGFFVQPDLSPQKRFTLPNKFFEYVTAGLALCVSDLPEMARFVREHELGVLVRDATREGIAEALGPVDRAAVDRFKGRSLEAARTLDWNREKRVMLGLYDRLVPARTVQDHA
jgi:glycosyltransferase involved in cell wall biosynthesis